MDFKKNYYKILEVSEGATELEIKLAYRRLAKQYHPDRNPGNAAFEEKTKEINEAKEILLDADSRFVYDEYRKSVLEEEIRLQREKVVKKKDPRSASAAPEKKTYTRTRTIETITRHYFKGKIFIKYYAPLDKEKGDPSLREFYYKVNFTDVHIEVDEQDMQISQFPPVEYTAVFTDYPQTNIPVLQPVKTIIRSDKKNKAVLFTILDFRITDPQIILVTKHETTSFGTIESPVYGYIKESKFHDITEEVEESSGPTGREETKTEENVKYKREEHYYYNGDTYWSKWKRETPSYDTTGFKSSSPEREYNFRRRQKFNTYVSSDGCASSTLSTILLIIYIGFLLFSIPAIWPVLGFFLILYVLPRLTNFAVGSRIRFASWFSTLFFVLFFIALFSRYSYVKQIYPKTTVSTETAKEKEMPVIEPIHSYDPLRADSIITRYRSWTDYDNTNYTGSYSVRASQVADAGRFKNTISYPVNNNMSYDHMIYDLKNHDSDALSSLYILFDTTRIRRALPADKFAEMIVSFVQDIPYSLVLDKSCDPSQYNIKSVRKYLAKDEVICEPYQRFGINTPVEFLTTLKGDCDTRALLLYQVLSHYHYDVVMLTSDIYNHSVIGINLPYAGVSYLSGGQSYVLWETTSPGFRPGFIPSEISDLNYWRISLKSK